MTEENLQDNGALVQHILRLAEDIYRSVPTDIPPDWLTADLTVAQLRVLLLLYTRGEGRMSAIASGLGIAVSTATGIVDNLVRKGLVTRGNDPEDRRLVICALSSHGHETVNGLWTFGRFQIEKLLEGLSREQLEKAAEVADLLLRNVTAKTPALPQSSAE